MSEALVTFPFTRHAGDLINPPQPPEDFPRIGKVQLPTGDIAWLLTAHEDVRAMLRSPAFSSDQRRPGFPFISPRPPSDVLTREGFFLGMDPPDHTVYRRIFTPEFMIKNMRRLEPLIRETVIEALDGLRAAGQPADLVEHFAVPVPSMVICHLLGVPYSDHQLFQGLSRTLVDRVSAPEARRDASIELRKYLAELVAAKELDSSGEDLISRVAAERVATGEISSGALVGASVLLLIAGHETTANMIGLSMLLLLQRPDELARLREHPDAIDDAVEELLRYLTIVRTGLVRVAVEDTEVGGYPIRAGEGVIAMLAAANRDGAVFPSPDELRLDRGAHHHMAFGFGIHQCIGQPLARTELRLSLRELVARFPTLALAGQPSDLDGRDDSVVYGLSRLMVTW